MNFLLKATAFLLTASNLVLAAGLSKTQVANIKNAEDVSFVHDFPKNPFSQLVIDDKAMVRINMTNNSPLSKTVFGITGYYTDPEDAGKDPVKISSDKVQILVKSGKTIHLKYKFIPQAHAGTVGLLVVVDYYDSDEPAYKSVGALQSIQLVYGDSLFDFQRYNVYINLEELIV